MGRGKVGRIRSAARGLANGVRREGSAMRCGGWREGNLRWRWGFLSQDGLAAIRKDTRECSRCGCGERGFWFGVSDGGA